MFFKLLSFGTLIFGLHLSAEKAAGPDCIFGENAHGLMEEEVSGIGLVSHRYVLGDANPKVDFPEGASLVQTSTLSAIEKNQILAAINHHQTERSFKRIQAAIRHTDDAFVNLILLKHSQSGKLYTLVEFGLGNSNSFGAVYPVDSLEAVAINNDGDLYNCKPL